MFPALFNGFVRFNDRQLCIGGYAWSYVNVFLFDDELKKKHKLGSRRFVYVFNCPALLCKAHARELATVRFSHTKAFRMWQLYGYKAVNSFCLRSKGVFLGVIFLCTFCNIFSEAASSRGAGTALSISLPIATLFVFAILVAVVVWRYLVIYTFTLLSSTFENKSTNVIKY